MASGTVLLTQAGRDLVAVCKSAYSDEYFMAVLEKWSSKQIILSMPIEAKPQPSC
jgi:hypothetical protein